MPRKGENIYKRKDGRWEGRFIAAHTANGKIKYAYVYGKSYKEVKTALAEKKNHLLFIKNRELLVTPTYGEILLQWLDPAKLRVKESTFARYYHLATHHILPYLGKYSMLEINSETIEYYIHTLLTNGRLDGKGGLSTKTVSDILVIIKSTFTCAKRAGYPVPEYLGHISVKKEATPLRVLTLTEQSLLEQSLLREINPLKFGVLLSLYTGIRIGELCALRWKCFDFNTGLLHIRETMQRIQNITTDRMDKTKIIITTPKSLTSIRCIPLPSFILELALTLKKSPESFLLTGSTDSYVEPRTMQNHFKKYIQQSGLESLNYHILRHTFATRCVELGFEIKSLSEILGHSSVNITLNRYVHASLELKKRNMNKLKLTV